jgi:hypothetical protein
MHCAFVFSYPLADSLVANVALKQAARGAQKYSDFARRACEICSLQGDAVKLAASNVGSWYVGPIVTSLSKEGSLASVEDATILSALGPHALFNSALWPVEMPNEISDNWIAGQSFFENKGGAWNYWGKWFASILNGNVENLEFHRRVALIDQEVWEAGADAVAEAIAEIEAEWLAEQWALDTVKFDSDNAKFFTEARPTSLPSLLSATLSQVEDALEDVLNDDCNGLNERSRDVKVLRRTLTKYGNDPLRIEMNFTSVHRSLTRQIVVGDLPASEENISLQEALEEAAQGIRGSDPEVEAHRNLLDRQKIKEMDAAQKALVEEAAPMLEAISEGAMQETFREDVAFLLEPRFRVVDGEGADETRRVIGYAAKIGVLMRKSSDIVKQIDGSGGYKAARILTTIAGLVTIGIALLG